MATNHARLPQRRTMAQRAKADENAMSRHLRQGSNVGGPGASRFTGKEVNGKPAQRQALGEVTHAAVNRKENVPKPNAAKDLKEEPASLKRGRSDSTTVAQRVPLGPGRAQVAPPVANSVTARAPTVRARISTVARRITRVPAPTAVAKEVEEARYNNDAHAEMDVEEDTAATERRETKGNALRTEETENFPRFDDSDNEDDEVELPPAKIQRVWPEVSTEHRKRFKREVEAVQERFEDVVNVQDMTMVSEYADEIFEYMNDLEEEMMPSPNYMDDQHEITWQMRQTLVDWLLQVHLRYHMWPETLWIAINIVDRFLSKRVVSLVKLQLVGVTAMFIAAKYEEIIAPSVEEFVFMTENGYSKDEILKGERIMLQTLEFNISHYCSPYSWMRKISKADDYDIQTRTLSKFLTEVTLLDHRFLRVKPSLIAAVGMYCARKMLGGDWNDAFVFHSGYTEEQLLPGHQLLVEKLTEPNFSRAYVCKKYAHKKFLKASTFAVDWATAHLKGAAAVADGMVLEH